MAKTYYGLSKHLVECSSVFDEGLGLYVPDWLPESLALGELVEGEAAKLKRLFTFHRVPPTISKALYTLLLTLAGSVDFYVVLDLLNTKTFRSEFRAHQREQLDQWLESETLQTAYPRCFRPTIFERLTLQHNLDAHNRGLSALRK
jgi:hypothetical protein